MAGQPHVALVVETSTMCVRRILRGITHYLRSRVPWSWFFEQRGNFAPLPSLLRTWRGDGVICRLMNPPLTACLRREEMLVVDLDDIHADLDMPCIEADQRAIGSLAADHSLERGFRHTGYCSFAGQHW
jgi:LacI family transcriptional regulator, galactose operon repressor